MKVLLYSRNGQYPKEIEVAVKNSGLEILDPSTSLGMTTPQVVVTFGGDGTLLGAERDFPGIPKLPVKDSGTGYHTIQKPIEETLKLFVDNKLQIKSYFKLEAALAGNKFLALNEVTIRNSLPTSALRFSVESHPEQRPMNIGHVEGSPTILIGDGLIISTPFGSSGYFYSISKRTFETGIGLAFNNIHNTNPAHQIVDDNSEIEVKILRGPAQITFDNDPEIPTLKDDETIKIKKSPSVAKIYTL